MTINPKISISDEVSEFLATRPTAEEILAYQPSAALDQRLHELLDLNSEGRISPDQRAELDEMLRIGHLISMLKIKTRLRLAGESE